MAGITKYTDESWKKTNADRIRRMSDKELAKLFNDMRASFECVICGDGKRCLAFDECEDCWLDWLKQEAEA